MLDRLAAALEPDWHTRRTAGRVTRHTKILQGIAHELSTNPKRRDRPETSKEAEERLSEHLAELKRSAPRRGLGAATGKFVDHIEQFTKRCGRTLFPCFDDERIPSTSNQLEGFFDRVKRRIRQATGEKSTANSPVRNLGDEFLIAVRRIESVSPEDMGAAISRLDTTRFYEERRRLDAIERPARRRRSMVRNFTNWLGTIRQHWLQGLDPAPG